MKNIYPLLSLVINDKSWRIQYVIVENFENIILSIQSNNKKTFLDFYLKCLQSSEEEVIIMSLKKLKNVSRHLEPEFII